jgi:GNAT superfamily N-acetyltransferase
MPEPATSTLVRRAQREDWPAIERFLAANYGAEAPFKHHARWLWQFVHNPFHLERNEAPTVWIALEGDEVIGQLSVQDGQVRIATRTYPAGWIVDVMVDARARGRGLGHAIHRAIMAERPLLVTLTMAPATRRIADRAGALTLGPVREYVLPVALSGATISHLLANRAAMRRSRAPALARALDLAARLPAAPDLAAAAMRGAARLRQRPAPVDGRIEEMDRLGEAADALWERLANRFPASFVRTSQFLDWRFGQAPDLTYRKFLLKRGGAVAGWLVTRARIRPSRAWACWSICSPTPRMAQRSTRW